MCYLVMERYSICRCLYYKHDVDMCAAYGQQGHHVEERTVLVGYTCEQHEDLIGDGSIITQDYGAPNYGDSGYGSISSASVKGRRKGTRRWIILPSVQGVLWSVKPLFLFDFEDWLSYLYSFRGREPVLPPSWNELLTVGSQEEKSSSQLDSDIQDQEVRGLPQEMLPQPTRSETQDQRNKSSPEKEHSPYEAPPVPSVPTENQALENLERIKSTQNLTRNTHQQNKVTSHTESSDTLLENGSDSTITAEKGLSPELMSMRTRLISPDKYFEDLRKLQHNIWSNSWSAGHQNIIRNPISYQALLDTMDGPAPVQLQLKSSNQKDCVNNLDVQDLHRKRIDDCLNVLTKTLKNLWRLQKSSFCSQYFSIIVADDSRPCVARLLPINITEFVEFTHDIWNIWSSVPSDGAATVPPSLQVWCEKLLPFETSALDALTDQIDRLQLLTHILDFGVVSYVGAHTHNFLQPYIEEATRTAIVRIFLGNSPKVVLKQCHLQCLDNFHHGNPVWVFAPDGWNSSGEPIFLSTTMEAFADIWGPLWKASLPGNSGQSSAYMCGNGAIIRWEHDKSTAPELVGNEVYCHWISEDEIDQMAINTNLHDNIASLINSTFKGTETLLIGAVTTGKQNLVENSTCGLAVSRARAHLKDLGRLTVLGVTKSYMYSDSLEYQLQLGYGGINAAATKQYKRVSGQSLKDALYELWAMDPAFRDPKLLSDLYGLEVSLCTFNARRVPLSEVLRLKANRGCMRNFSWEKAHYETEYFETLQDGSRQTRSEDPLFRKQFENAVLFCLKVLRKTGVDRKDNLSVFMSSECTPKPELATLVHKEHSWIGLLKDTTIECTMAVFGDSCLEFKHRKGVKCGGTGCTVLRTALVPNDVATSLNLVRRKETTFDGSSAWMERWDVSSMELGKDIWLGERGTLRLLSHLRDGTLLVDWRASPVITAVKLLRREQPHREFVEIDYSGADGIRPTPVFVISDRVGEE